MGAGGDSPLLTRTVLSEAAQSPLEYQIVLPRDQYFRDLGPFFTVRY